MNWYSNIDNWLPQDFLCFQQILMSIEKDLVTPKLEAFKKEEPETTAKQDAPQRPNSCEVTQKKDKHVRINLDDEPSHRKRVKSQRSDFKRPKDLRSPIREHAKRLLTQQYKQASRRKYGNASRCKTRIQRLRNQVVSDSMRKLERKHEKDRQKIRQAHLQELAELDQFYSSVVQLHKERSNDLFTQWERKQHHDIQKLERSLSKSRRGPNCSAEVLMLNDIEQMLVDKELYPEAEKIRKQMQKAKRNFRKSFQEEQNGRERQLKLNLWQQHKKEYQVLIDRIEHSCQERDLRYQKQRQKLQQHYQNVMSQLMRHHILQVQKLNRSASMLQKFINKSRNNVRWIIQSQQI